MTFQVKYLLFLYVFIQFVALFNGILSLTLPFWIDAEHDEGEMVVNISRKSHSGLWQKRDAFEIRESNPSKLKWDETLQPVHDTDDLWAVKGLMISGLSMELICFIGSVVECCISEKKYLKHITTIGIGTILASLFTVILMAIGPIVFVIKVFHDNEYDKKEYGAGFWLAIVSTVMCLASTVLSFFIYLCFRRIKRRYRRNSLHSTAVRY